MTKSDFIEALREYGDYTHAEAFHAVNSVFGLLQETLISGESVTMTGFAKFEICERGARTARNPRTGETIEVPSHKTLKFKASSVLKDAIR